MRFPIFAGLLLAAFAILDTACKKPTAFGSDLLTDEYADYDFTDTITVDCTLIREDSINTSDRAGVASYFLCGKISNDEEFGTYSSDIYSLLIAESLNPQFKPDSTTMDSIVMYLNYAPGGVYGDTLKPQTLQVFRLNGQLGNDSAYYSNSTIAQGMEIGRKDNFLPTPHKTDSLYEGTKGAFLRVRLDDNFGKELLELDSLDWQSDSAFYQKLRGLKIVCAPDGNAQGAMLAFNLNNIAMSRVSLYYTEKGDTAQSRFDFYFRNTNKFTHFEHDYTGSKVLPFIGKRVTDKMYVQGMQGLRMKVSFPYANNLNQIAVNKAQLVLTIADDNPWLLPADQLVLTEFVGDTVYNFTSDVVQSLASSSTGVLKSFGGFPEEEFDNGTLINRYRMSLSEKFQHIVDDDVSPKLENRTVYISVYPRSRSARRSVLYGTDKSNPLHAKLELKYTRVR